MLQRLIKVRTADHGIQQPGGEDIACTCGVDDCRRSGRDLDTVTGQMGNDLFRPVGHDECAKAGTEHSLSCGQRISTGGSIAVVG